MFVHHSVQYVLCDGEYGPVVVLEYSVPHVDGSSLRVLLLRPGGFRHLLVVFRHTGQLILEYQGVGEDGAGDPPGLLAVRHFHDPCDSLGCYSPFGRHLVQMGARDLYTVGKCVDGFLHGLLWHGHEIDHFRQVRHRSVHPSVLWKADVVRVVDCVLEFCRAYGLRNPSVGHLPEFWWVGDGYGRLHPPRLSLDSLTQPRQGFPF